MWEQTQSLCGFGMSILLYLRLSLASSFKKDSMSPALAPGIHLTMVAGVSKATFLTIELPITRVLSSAGVSLSGGKKSGEVDGEPQA